MWEDDRYIMIDGVYVVLFWMTEHMASWGRYLGILRWSIYRSMGAGVVGHLFAWLVGWDCLH